MEDIRRREPHQTPYAVTSIVQLIVILGFAVGIYLMYTYDEKETNYTVGMWLTIITGIIIGLNILFILFGLGMVGYVLLK